MFHFAQGECVLVKKDLATPNNRALNCHYNVKAQIELCGGKVVNGWLLDRTPNLLNNGVWHWSFHSIWETNDGNWFDPTIDKHNSREYSTFWPDTNRALNLEEGYAYNDIVIFESEHAVNLFGSLSTGVVTGEVFWAARNFALLKHHSEHSGRYRFLRPEFPNNYAKLERDYGLTVVNGCLHGTTHQTAPIGLFFDYSV